MTVKVLLCEDNLGDVYLIENSLNTAQGKYSIDKLLKGGEVMKYLRQKANYQYATRPDMIILDLNLPGRHGFEILEEIKADPLLKTIPVVILTSSKSKQDIFKSYQLQASCYIIKPSDLEAFLAAIKQIENFWFSCVELPQVEE
ncbi:MAG: response regulator [Cyanobacteria bacterium P01_A01_bin.83]